MPAKQNPALQTLGHAYGGHGGSPFDDRAEAASGPVTQITLQAGSYIDAISLTYGTHITWHGGPGGQPRHLTLAPGEYIIHVEGHAGHWLDSLKLTTNHGQTIQGGGHGGHHFVVPNPDGLALHAIVGRAGDYLDQIQFIFGSAPVAGKAAAAPKKAAARKSAAAPKKTASSKAAPDAAATKPTKAPKAPKASS